MGTTLKYYAHGKLLITGEYTVLDGALALAIPTALGQSMVISPWINKNGLKWMARDVDQHLWFTCEINQDLSIETTSDPDTTQRLVSLLRQILHLKPNFSKKLWGYQVETTLEFNRHWGLGSSSTLIDLLSQWADISPYPLLDAHFKGSGYDIACARAIGPILYQRQNDTRIIKNITLRFQFSHHMFLIYLNKKQLSLSEVTAYHALDFDREALKTNISTLTQEITEGCTEKMFCEIIEKHEALLSETLKRPPIKIKLFSTIEGTFKSLGAWGGDFALFIGDPREIKKIKALGYTTILQWDQLQIHPMHT